MNMSNNNNNRTIIIIVRERTSRASRVARTETDTTTTKGRMARHDMAMKTKKSLMLKEEEKYSVTKID